MRIELVFGTTSQRAGTFHVRSVAGPALGASLPAVGGCPGGTAVGSTGGCPAGSSVPVGGGGGGGGSTAMEAGALPVERPSANAAAAAMAVTTSNVESGTRTSFMRAAG